MLLKKEIPLRCTGPRWGRSGLLFRCVPAGQEGPGAEPLFPGSAQAWSPGCWRGAGTAPRQSSTAVAPALGHLAAPGGHGVLGWPWTLPDYPASPSPPAASRAGHARSLASHQRLTPSYRGVAKHLSQPELRRAKEGQGCPQCKGAARPLGEPRGGEGKTSLFLRCRSCVCSPRWVFRLSGTGLLGKSDPRVNDASAELQLGTPRGLLAAVLGATRSGPLQATGQRAGWRPAVCPGRRECQQQL